MPICSHYLDFFVLCDIIYVNRISPHFQRKGAVMPSVISVTRSFSVPALLDIENPEFARLYGLGVFWAIYGEEQGRGAYEDTYLIENICRNLHAGWYDSLSSPWFASIGFYLGMVHGGMIDPATRQLGP